MKKKKIRQPRSDSPAVIRVLPIQDTDANEVSDKNMTRDQELAKTKRAKSKRALEKKVTNIFVCTDTVWLVQVIALFVNPFIYVTFSVVYFVLGPLS